MSTYYFGKSNKDNQWYFRLKDNNNETILSSTEGYSSRQGCINGIDSVKQHSPHDRYYYSFTGQDSKYYFRLKASNGEPIGKSEAYNTASGRDKGIDNCKKEAPGAAIKELSTFD